MPRLLLGTSVWPSFLSALMRPTQISTHSQMAACANGDGIFSHTIQSSPTLNAATLDFSALSPSHKQSTLQMTQCSNCSPLSLHFLISQVTHRSVPGDVRSYPCDGGITAACPAPSEAAVSHPSLGLPCSPGFPLPLLQWARQGRAALGMSLPCSTPGGCTHKQGFLLPRVTIQGSLHGFVWWFCLEFPTDTKKSLHLPPFWRHLLHSDSPWHSSVTLHQPELCISQPCSAQNRSEQPDARKRIMKLVCHICTGRLKADKLLSSWKWVLQQGEDWKQLGCQDCQDWQIISCLHHFYTQFQLPDQRREQGSLK